MKFSVIFSLLILVAGTLVQGETITHGFDKTSFYAALSSENLEMIDAQLSAVKNAPVAEKEAYEGALLMKKAGVIKGTAKEKLIFFKSGRSKLESAIAKNNNNIEYRFLRLIIQEHAPKIVKYRNDIEQDSRLIITNFKSLPQDLQQTIADYSKASKVLKIG